MRHPLSAPISTLSLCLLLALAFPAIGADDSHPALGAYSMEMSRFLGTPGSSHSVGAGLLNPAAWGAHDDGGMFLSWDDIANSDGNDLLGAFTLGNTGFGVRRRTSDADSRAHYDYSYGIGFGDRSMAMGLSYNWSRGNETAFGRTRRLTLGAIHRWRRASLGTSVAFEFESDDIFYQADLGVRPFGPRWTFFADAILRNGDETTIPGSADIYDDLALGFGVEANLLPGVSLAARGTDAGAISLGFRIGLGPNTRPGYAHHMNDDGDRISSSYTLDTRLAPHIGQIGGKPDAYPELHLAGPLAYRNFRYFDERRNFMRTLEQLERYAESPEVGGVVLNLSSMALNPAKLWELRHQLAGMRASGKKVIVYFDRLSLFDYMLASVADEIWMDPQGDLDIKGIAFGRTYYKRMLDKMGLGVDEWRFFRYKSAMESFARTDRSDGDREQIERLRDDWYAETVKTIMDARDISRAEWDRLVDEKGELLASEALAAGLVDRIGDFHEARDAAAEAGIRSGRDAAAASLGGLYGDRIWEPLEWSEPPRIAVLYAIGGCSMDSGIEGRRLSKVIRRVREDDSIKAVVLRADSPGGDPLPSDLVARELALTAEVKPVIVSQGMVAASGGYWISMHGDEILASPYTITGSIGVISGHIWDAGMSEKVGMDYDVIKVGEHSDVNRGPSLPFVGVSVPSRPVTPEERQRAEDVILALYDDFVGQVADGRDMPAAEIREIAQGRIWTGNDGLENGLVDQIGGLWESVQLAKARAGIGSGDRMQLIEGPSIGAFDFGGFRPSLLGIELPRIASWIGMGGSSPAAAPLLAGEPWGRLAPMEKLYLEQILLNNGKPLLLMEPITIEGVTLEP